MGKPFWFWQGLNWYLIGFTVLIKYGMLLCSKIQVRILFDGISQTVL